MADLTFFAQAMDRRYGDTLLCVEAGIEPLYCQRCGHMQPPMVAVLDTDVQPHAKAAFCGQCVQFLRYLPKDTDKPRRCSLSPSLRFAVFERDGWRCAYCGRETAQLEPGEYLQVDHVTSIANGGSNEMGNLTTACSTCNLGKAAGPKNA